MYRSRAYYSAGYTSTQATVRKDRKVNDAVRVLVILTAKNKRTQTPDERPNKGGKGGGGGCKERVKQRG